MSQANESIRERVIEWCANADEDIESAEALLSRDPPLLRSVCFHSQQCAEKYLKALLAAHQIEFPKTHEIEELVELVGPVDAVLAESLRDVRALTPYGVQIRYPPAVPKMSLERAREAFSLASKVRDAVREALGEEWLPEDGYGSTPRA